MIDINSLRLNGERVHWVDNGSGGLRLFAVNDTRKHCHVGYVDKPNHYWATYRGATETSSVIANGNDCADVEETKQRVYRLLLDEGVLTVVSETPAAVSMKFIRLPAPLPWKANEILRTADVNAIYGDVSTYTVDIPAAKADAIVALLLLLDINAKSYEV